MSHYYLEVRPYHGRNQSVRRRYDITSLSEDAANRFYQRLNRALNWRRYFISENYSPRRLPRVRKPVYNA
ncbi:hypothetical protein [Hymenobacter guriensis]|uniref:WGR domain-containing protein n=1 Tax=Hymenobacter guriensis TaxID=2793065 RepID=A0ABS0KX04_9BACT|nr:hypothetical protein [Hymenobacter guriensis]MBG8552336.1 hypothetical protein [Hymenobacter guriensis]